MSIRSAIDRRVSHAKEQAGDCKVDQPFGTVGMGTMADIGRGRQATKRSYILVVYLGQNRTGSKNNMQKMARSDFLQIPSVQKWFNDLMTAGKNGKPAVSVNQYVYKA